LPPFQLDVNVTLSDNFSPTPDLNRKEAMRITLAYVFIQWFGVVGVALATSIMYIMSCGFLVLVSLRLIKQKTGEGR